MTSCSCHLLITLSQKVIERPNWHTELTEMKMEVWREMRSRAGIESKQLQKKEVVKLHKNERRIPFYIIYSRPRFVLHFFYIRSFRAQCIRRTRRMYRHLNESSMMIFMKNEKLNRLFFMNEHTRTQCAANLKETKRSRLDGCVLFQEFWMLWSI